MEYKDYYKILEVDKKASKKDIKRSYRRLARKYHPDKNPDNKASEETFKAINEAYEVLGDQEKRAKYDQLGSSYHRYQQMGGAPSGFDYSRWSTAGPGGGRYQATVDLGDLFGDGGGFSDFFNNIFGGSRSRGSGAGRGGFSRQAAATGQDIEHELEISLEEAYQGTSRVLSRQDGDQFTAKIPPGAKTGTKIRLSGKGAPGPRGPGNLFLVIKVKPHPTFKRLDNNLATTIPVDVVTAVLGGKVAVPTLSGSVKLTIPPGTQGGQTMSLKGRGMPHLQDKQKFGDLLATVRIFVPEQLTDEQRRLYTQLAAISAEASD